MTTEEEHKELIKAFLTDCTCKWCGKIQPYIWKNEDRLCKRCFKQKYGIRLPDTF